MDGSEETEEQGALKPLMGPRPAHTPRTHRRHEKKERKIGGRVSEWVEKHMGTQCILEALAKWDKMWRVKGCWGIE